MRPLRHAYAELATIVNVAWLERRDRAPWVWVLPLAVMVALLGPH